MELDQESHWTHLTWKEYQIHFAVESIPNHVSRLQWDPCSAPGQTNMLMSDMPGVFCVLFKVCQEVHRGECVSSLLNPEPLVSHHITNLPPPAVCADPATKHLIPGCCTEHFGLSFVPTAIRLQTVQSFLPHWPRPEPAKRVPAHADYYGLFMLRATPWVTCLLGVYVLLHEPSHFLNIWFLHLN